MKRQQFIKILCLVLIWFGANAICNIHAQENEQSIDVTVNEEDKVFESHIQDAKTGESLPYVSIYVASGIGTMTNIDGDFSIKTNENADLRISYIGYRTMTIKAGKLPKILKMEPTEYTLNEVVVLPIQTIMNNVKKKLMKDLSSNKKKTSRYFYRQLVSTKNNELAEAFLEAKSTVNLRQLTFLSGRHGRKTANGLTRPLIADMNFHHPLELGLLLEDVTFWKGLHRPFYSKSNMAKRIYPYDYEIETMYDEGRKIYKISFGRQKGNANHVVLTGSIYVDAETYQLYSYDGKVEGMYLDVKKDFVQMHSPIDLNIHIKYRHINKYTEVENVSYTLKSGDLTTNALLFNVDGLNMSQTKKDKKQKTVKENMLTNIDDANFDDIMKQNADIVKRTDDEAESAESEESTSLLTTRYSLRAKRTHIKWTLDLPDNAIGNLTNRLAKIGQIIPQEKVYVHMDNTNYYLGDSIWFSAYLRRTNDDQLSNISGILYVELLNYDGYLMERQIIDTKDGYGHGAFYINPDWYAGYYEIRAYTRWQLNWGVTEHKHSEESKYWFINEEMQKKYFRDYEKLYSRVFPVYDAPKNPGEYNENMTLREMVSHNKSEQEKQKLQVKFYPEGGELIEGVPCRVAYEASYTDGLVASGVLTLDNGKNATQTTIHTINRGRGVFEYTPSNKQSRKVRFTATSGEEYTDLLPKAQPDGVVLSVIHNDSLWNIRVIKAGVVKTQNLGLTIMHEGRVRHFMELNDEKKEFSISNDSLECGVNQITVFDEEGRVFADRLFFVSRPELSQKTLEIKGIKNEYKPYEEITLSVDMNPDLLESISNKRDNKSGFVSLSVRDKDTSDDLYDNASMQAEMLLSSEIRGFVPSPDWYFEKDDEEHRQALDLLMMTQGWRRFDWRKMAVRGEWDLTQPDERTPVITGKLYTYDPFMFYHPKDIRNFFAPTLPTNTEEQPTQNTNAENSNSGNSSNIDNSQTTINEPATSFSEEIDNYTETYRNLKSKIKGSVLIHAELAEYESKNYAKIEIPNSNGQFRITLPKFKTSSVFFLSASDTAKWKGSHRYEWVQSMPDYDQKKKFRSEDAEFSIRVDQPYPRFVKPYSYYQENIYFTEDGLTGESLLEDGSRRLAEIRVKAKRKGYRTVNDTLPAFMIDGYDAYNYAMDAGMTSSMPTNILRAYIGDYGLEKPYVTGNDPRQKDYRLHVLYGGDIRYRAIKDMTLDIDSVSLRRNLTNNRYIETIMEEEAGSKAVEYWNDYYGDLNRIEKYVVYTDYQPRHEGSSRYYGSNLPHTYISIVPYADDSMRKFYRDRRFLFDGIATPTEFYQPDYSNNCLPVTPDHRRTLYWNPRLPLDANGKATVSFWNNSRTTQITVNAEGVSNNGQAIGN